MSNLLRDFEVEAKNPSLEARQRWRSSVSIVKNPTRRFRNIRDLDKLADYENKKHQIQVPISLVSLSLFSSVFFFAVSMIVIFFVKRFYRKLFIVILKS